MKNGGESIRLGFDTETMWSIEEPQPTNLIALWNGDETPKQEFVCDALLAVSPELVDVVVLPTPQDTELRWLAAIRNGVGDHVMSVWAEPMRPMQDDHRKFLNAESVRWVVGIETVLDSSEPLSHFVSLLQLLSSALPDSPAILDVNKEGWHARKELDEIFLSADIEPDESLLWMIHAICPDQEPNEQSKAWVYSQGLHRCGLPELEMIDVSYPYVGSAIHTLNAIAGLILEHGLPAPHESFEIGSDLAVTLIPWNEVAPAISDESFGGMNARNNHGGQSMTGAHAVVCAVESTSPGNRQWVWPSETLARIAQGNAVVYKTARATQRQAHLARKTLQTFVSAFAQLRRLSQSDDSAQFLIKAGFSNDNSLQDREHLWFDVREVDKARIQGQLLHKPLITDSMNHNDYVWINREQISDWVVQFAGRQFEPGVASALDEAIAKLHTDTHHV